MISTNAVLSIPMLFAHTTREFGASTFIGIERTEMFKAIFEMLKPKARVMTLKLHKRANSAQLTQTLWSSKLKLQP